MPDVGNPLYDELAATYVTAPAAPTEPPAGDPAPAPQQHAETTGSATARAAEFTTPALVLDLFTRMKRIGVRGDGWNGGDTVNVLASWFGEFGIDADADEVAAAQTLRMPARLAALLIAPTLDEADLVIHLRTDNHSPMDYARFHLSALISALGEDSSAAVFDVAGDQIAHLVPAAADPAAVGVPRPVADSPT